MNTEQILQLEPSREADRAFAEVLLGWSHSTGNIWIDSSGAYTGYVFNARYQRNLAFAPTTGNDGKGDPAAWWLGVERLRALGLDVYIMSEGDKWEATCESKAGGETDIYYERVHQNPAIAVLRAGVLALREMGEIE